MLIEKDIRIDKWLWAARVFKTRGAASDACRRGRVLINNDPVKPSRTVRLNDIISVRRSPVTYTYKVKGLLGKRLSARLIGDYVENLTPESEMEKLNMKDDFFVYREKGSGRPTKKDRRSLDKIHRRHRK